MTTFQTSGTTGPAKRFTADIAARASDIARIRPPGWGELTSLYNDFGDGGPGTLRDAKWAADKGATLYRPTGNFETNIKQLVDNNVEAIFAPPPFYARLITATVLLGAYRPKIYIVSGAPLKAKLAAEILGVFPDNGWENYSVSEAGTLTSCTIAEAAEVEGFVGKPYPGVEMRVVEGQIECRTPIMIKEYADPKLTAAKFTADGWLRTGDRGHVTSDGNWVWEGRV